MTQFSAVLANLTVFLLSQFVIGLNFPSPLEKCHFNDEKCMIDRAHKLIQTFPHGLDIIGLPDMEPLNMGTIELVGDKNSPASINLFMTNVKFHHFSNITINKIRGFSKDVTKPMTTLITAFHPKMILKSKYKVSGRILVLPITGDGDLEWIISGTESKLKQALETEQRDGKTYLKIKDFKASSKSKHIKIDLTNLFNGDKALSESMLNIINESWEVLAAEIQPLVDRELAAIYRKFFKKLYDSMPYDEFFLPDQK